MTDNNRNAVLFQSTLGELKWIDAIYRPVKERLSSVGV